MIAQDFDSIQQNAGINPPDKVGILISDIFRQYVFYAAGIALLVYLVMGGFQLMVSRGDPKAVEGGKGKITNALIGFIIVFISYWIVTLLGKILGLDTVNEIFR